VDPTPFTLADFRACAKTALMKRGRAEGFVDGPRLQVVWPNGALASIAVDLVAMS
jgi:hypothetical protein